ncbi:ribbon-helix-helix protein, CopG family [Candidatus Parcubacteria bacterium]|nr:MAG: ribbon-helix-helix protein, CopG family [Candidatus Parcubacteria bacterium]
MDHMTTLTKRPIQVYLEARQDQALRRLAAEEGVSLSELIRRSVDLLLAELPVEQDPAWKIVGLGSSDVSDLGTRHDEHIVQELSKEINR